MSRLPWRGQFSPDLIDYFINVICPKSQLFLDPFCGSGTVLYEAAINSRAAFGLEVNPAAWHLSSLASFGLLAEEEKKYVFEKIKNASSDFDFLQAGMKTDDIVNIINNENHLFTRKVLACAFILGIGIKSDLSPDILKRGAFTVIGILKDLTEVKTKVECQLGDARSIPLQTSSIEAVITSPPYINVFNYHQNYRVAVELLGWIPLEAARSEIGSNRKNRGNRFLTVIQYCLDMALCFTEIARVLRVGSPLIVVIGRTSNVLGTPFENSNIIQNLLGLASGFGEIQVAERVFTSRFGERIFEDILITNSTGLSTINLESARGIGIEALKRARSNVPDKNRSVLEDAILGAETVAPSPSLSLSIPVPFLY